MADYPALPLWTDAFLADTIHLNAKETGAYIMLLMSAWRTPDCGLPNDDKKLARMSRCSAREWKSIKSEVLSFFYVHETKLYQKKLLKVRQNVATKSEKARTAAQAKWLKGNESEYADASSEHMPQTCQPKPKPKPKDTNVSNKKTYKKSFEDFWIAYPRKVGKASAAKSFDQALKRATVEEIAQGLNRIMPTWKTKDPQYIPHAATWLNRDGWYDEPDPPPHGGSSGNGNQMVEMIRQRRKEKGWDNN